MEPYIFSPVEAPQHKLRRTVRSALGGRLGRLDEVAGWVAACQGRPAPSPFQRPRAVLFAGDYGVAELGVAGWPENTSVELARAISAGAGPVNALARSRGVGVRLVDTSLDHEAWGPERVSRSTARIDREDALDSDAAQRALHIGRSIADQEIDSGADLLVPGTVGVGSEVIAAAVLGALSRTEPVAIVGTNLPTSVWKARVGVVRDAMFRVRDLTSDPIAVLSAISSPDFLAQVAFIAQAAARRTPLLIDDPLTVAAAFAAERLAPGTRRWLLAGQLSAEPVHLFALQALELVPLLALDLNLGQATGALAALPVLGDAIELSQHFLDEIAE